jgi:hypothetical protein
MPTGSMATEARGGGPYATAVALTAEPKAERLDGPAAARVAANAAPNKNSSSEING